MKRPDAAPLPRALFIIVGIVLIAAACVLGAVIFARGHYPFVIDTWWNDLLAAWASPFALGLSHVMDFLGGGWVGTIIVPLGGAIALVLMRRPWSAVYFLAAEAVSAAVVQVLKHVFGRVRPEDILVTSDYGSFPSGHVANAATIATAAVILFPQLWVLVVGAVWVVVMAFSRTYLHAHWFSDTIAGAMIGIGVALIVAAAFAVPIARERSVSLPVHASLE